MSFGADVFWPAFKDAGMLEVAVHQPLNGVAVSFDVGFSRPDNIVLDGMVHTTDYSIEYQAADVGLKRGDVLRILGVDYKVRQTPKAKADGSFFIAILDEVPA